MTPALPRTRFHSSKLIRCLIDLDMLNVVDGGDGLAEKLGLWVDFTDAIALSAVHDESRSGASLGMQAVMCRVPQPDAQVAIGAEFDHIQAVLVQSITRSCSSSLGKTHIKLPLPTGDLPLDRKTAYASYGRFYEAHARDMEMMIQPLRVAVRAALTRVSPKLKQLAELDAMFEKILRAREKQLLSKIPVLLKQRFDQLFDADHQKLMDTQQSKYPADTMQTGAWLTRFCNDMQMLLLAELDLRLQPTMGLIGTLNDYKQST